MHSRAGDPTRIAGYCGNSTVLDEALAEWAERYGDETERDHSLLVEARREGAIKAEAQEDESSVYRWAAVRAHAPVPKVVPAWRHCYKHVFAVGAKFWKPKTLRATMRGRHPRALFLWRSRYQFSSCKSGSNPHEREVGVPSL